MRICLVDDDSTQLDYLKLIIEKWADNNNVNFHIDFYHSSEEMLFENNESYPFDMILLDIQMGKINGIELAKKIRETDKNVTIAFLSGMADFVFDGYEVQAIRYILKPVKEEQIFELLDYAKTHISQEEKYLILSISGGKKKINYKDIIYFESMGHYIVLHLENEEFDYKYNISDLCNELANSDFIKTHRSYVVNAKYIERITKNECELINNIKVPLSRNSYKSVNERFINYYKGKIG
ncbi:Transcriptional regulatory protein YpdB [Candidatus Izimaplasma bacterium HR1]|jgi:DNA-binding LytR/AlgR family response regulator|uniref:LytR/AlgR family response regulator transcription factor n=1 Tax=Candidatus Izimoplasma sp. HR1 TaxID=1541959 RepID=UPI0004F68440|nr:Transcriptional regulatory protein YpdB [Candidatus Izimaplasma bacterium HR1]